MQHAWRQNQEKYFMSGMITASTAVGARSGLNHIALRTAKTQWSVIGLNTKVEAILDMQM